MFLIVIAKEHGMADHLVSTSDADEVLQYVKTLGENVGDPRTVQRIFSVDALGNTASYKVVFEGKLILKPIVIDVEG
jgi:hypothetical protein